MTSRVRSFNSLMISTSRALHSVMTSQSRTLSIQMTSQPRSLISIMHGTVGVVLSGSPRLAFAGGDDDDNKLNFELPQFGVSPGRTPSPSTPSCATPSDFDVSDVRHCLI